MVKKPLVSRRQPRRLKQTAAAVLVVSKRWLGDRPRVIDGSQSPGGSHVPCTSTGRRRGVSLEAVRTGGFGNYDCRDDGPLPFRRSHVWRGLDLIPNASTDAAAHWRGHPIGASGAILAVRLFHDLSSRLRCGRSGGDCGSRWIGSAMIVRGACEI